MEGALCQPSLLVEEEVVSPGTGILDTASQTGQEASAAGLELRKHGELWGPT